MYIPSTLALALLRLLLFSSARAYVLIGEGFDAPDSGGNHTAAIDMSNDGKYISVGSPHAGTDDQGQVKVYKSMEKDGQIIWEQVGNTILRNQKFAHFGISVSLSYDAKRLVVGSIVDHVDSDKKGSISIFRYVEAQNKWKWIQSFNGEPNEELGAKVEISANGNKVAAKGNGFVQVYKCFDDNSCVENGSRISIPDTIVKTIALAAGGQSLVIGAYDDNPEINSPAGKAMAYIFDKANKKWVLKSTFEGSDSSRTGYSVSISQVDEEITVAVGAPRFKCDLGDINCGKVRFFSSENRGETFSESSESIQGTLNNFVGLSTNLSANGDVVILSSLIDMEIVFKIYSKISGAWNLDQEIVSTLFASSFKNAVDGKLDFNGQRAIIVSPGLTDLTNAVKVFGSSVAGAPSGAPAVKPSISIAPSVAMASTQPTEAAGDATSGKGSKGSKGSKGKKH